MKGKMWTPNRKIARWYFGEKYVQVNVNIERETAYYKLVGFEGELENEDELICQLSYFTNVNHKRIYPSKF